MPLPNLVPAAVKQVRSSPAGAPSSSAVPDDVSAYGDRRDFWDVLVLAGVPMPGVAFVGGHGIQHHLDVKKAPGATGATITDLGRELGRIHVRLRMWTEAQLTEFKRVTPILQFRDPNTGKLDPCDVIHPGLNAINIRSVLVHKIGIPTVGRHDHGLVEVELELIEFRPPKVGVNATHTPKASRPIENHLSGNFMSSDGRTMTIRPSQDPAMIGPHGK